MDTQKIKKKIREQVTVERVAIAISSVVMYSYMMNKAGYRMVKPAYVTETHVVFNRPFKGVTAVRFDTK